MLSVPERLSSSNLEGCLRHLLKNQTVRFFYPSTYYIISTRFLYYFCLCKSFKELFLFCLKAQISIFTNRKSAALDIAQVNLDCTRLQDFLGESGCKGTIFFNTLQIFRELFSRKHKSFRDYLQNNGLHLIIIYKA